MLPIIDQRQIAVAAFLNLFRGWEAFLEGAMTKYMAGRKSALGRRPRKYVSPKDIDRALKILIGTGRYFDFANHENVKRVAFLYFHDGRPFEPHISSITTDLSDLRAMRNASAHISSTTQASLEAVAARVLGSPSSGIELYDFLMAQNPNSFAGETVFSTYKDKLLVVAELIANG
ncbi:hypothetical protein L2D00_03390 [Hyphomonadaceae bacterium BL14]|nr:hypothetical protein L2D00_03390 [Hyphomonadaceae bacterium BL14]